MSPASNRKSVRLAAILAGVVFAMVGLAYAAVPLYDIFCRVTGYGGTTQQAEMASDVVLDRLMTIDFDANTGRGMPWEFKPVKRKISIRVGETGIAFYEAYNPTDQAIVGTAAFNVTPQKIGKYFTKIQCFCFTEQVLQPGERVEMPVTFYVDPEISQDVNTLDVNTITLSYTFYVDEMATRELRQGVSSLKTVEPRSTSVN